ncbi:hypothetical protein BC830DRAFT_1222530 [Chytriomyces sp. MP71]|nr:hypothetical protein BC830DRAFT_1222530 [Chytriomyces sp. MP71]
MAATLSQEHALSYYAASVSVFSCLTIPALLHIIRVHLKTQGIKFSIKTFLSPFNASLLGLALSLAGLCASNSYALSTDINPQTRANCGAVQGAFVCSYHTFYIMYSYHRCIAIISLHLPSLQRVMRALPYAVPCILYASLVPQVAAAVIGSSRPGTDPALLALLSVVARAVNAAGSIAMLAFDMILLTAFTKASRKFRMESGLNVDEQRLVIISSYGTWAIVVYLVALQREGHLETNEQTGEIPEEFTRESKAKGVVSVTIQRVFGQAGKLVPAELLRHEFCSSKGDVDSILDAIEDASKNKGTNKHLIFGLLNNLLYASTAVAGRLTPLVVRDRLSLCGDELFQPVTNTYSQHPGSGGNGGGFQGRYPPAYKAFNLAFATAELSSHEALSNFQFWCQCPFIVDLRYERTGSSQTNDWFLEARRPELDSRGNQNF